MFQEECVAVRAVYMVFFFVTLLIILNDLQVRAIDTEEVYALLRLFNSTGGGGPRSAAGGAWINSTGWGTIPSSVCSWFGVQCGEFNGTSHVLTLQLSANALIGLLPDLPELRFLQLLNLSHNTLSGNIPSFDALINLEQLDLSNNAFNGSLPSFSPLWKLRELKLGTNRFTGTVPAFNQSNLQVVDLDTNQLVGTTPSFAALINLQLLDLSSNLLSGTIPSFDALSNLTYLFLSNNQLMGTIPSFETLTNLSQLELYTNKLTGTIPSFAALTGLTQLTLYINLLSGTIPSFDTLTNLKLLDLDTNNLTGTIPSLATLTNLQSLDLDTNQLTGSIPSFETLTNLSAIYLFSNQLTGSIPSFSTLKALIALDLNSNLLSGTIPSFNTLAKLEEIDLSTNLLTGSIPSFDTLINLQVLHLGTNQLTGFIPSFDSQLNLRLLDLSVNLLTGTIPSFSTTTSLTLLDLSTNRLLGTIPSFVNLSALGGLYLDNNLLTTLPVSWFPLDLLDGYVISDSQRAVPILPSLTRFSISGNQFSDSIDSVLQALFMIPNLSAVNLSHNGWSGQLSEKGFYSLRRSQTVSNFYLFQAGWPNLLSLDICCCNLTGSLPLNTEFPPPSSLALLQLDHNLLTGSIPEVYSSLLVLKVSQNQLRSARGELPSFLSFDPSHFSENSESNCSCAAFVGVSSQLVSIDSSYTNYSQCICDPGFAGRNCVCELCVAGSSSNGSSLSCKPCPQGSFSGAQAARCSQCSLQEYTSGPGSTACLPCDAEGVSCVNGLPLALPNYWMSVINDTGEVTTTPCLPGHCLGGRIDKQCGHNRVQSASNFLCGECVTGTAEWAKNCVPCNGVRGEIVFLIVALTFGYVLFIHQLARLSKSGLKPIFFYFVQTGLTLCGGIGTMVSWLAVFGAEPHNSVSICPAPLNAFDKMALDLVMPLLLFLILAIFLSIQLVWGFLSASFQWRLRCCFGKANWDHYFRSMFSLYLFGFSQMCTVPLQYVLCVDVGGSSVLYFIPSIHCEDPEYLRWRPAIISLLVFTVLLVPFALICYWILRRHKFQAAVTSYAYGSSQPHGFAYRWGIFFEPFKDTAPFYQLVILLRRFFVAIFVVYLVLSPILQQMSLALLHFLCCFLQVHLRPYRNSFENMAESVSLFLLGLLSLVFQAVSPNASSSAATVVVILFYVVPSCCAAAVLLLSLCIWARRKWLTHNARKRGSLNSNFLSRLSDVAMDRSPMLSDMRTEQTPYSRLDTDHE